MSKPRVLVSGATGFLGPSVVAALQNVAKVITLARKHADVCADLASPGATAAAVAAAAPDYVLHLAAMARMIDCERDPAMAQRLNADAPGEIAVGFGPRFVLVSTDLVFDGCRAPYAPLDLPMPLSEYGMSKAAGERQVLAAGGRVIRLPLLFGRDAKGRGATGMIRAAIEQGQPVTLFTNEYRTPLHVVDAAAALRLELFAERGPRIVHLAGPERLSRWELGNLLCARHGLPRALLVPVESQASNRPRDVSLAGTFRPERDLAAMLADA
jgi:dTDP-4-dehydrorhamnose reductase